MKQFLLVGLVCIGLSTPGWGQEYSFAVPTVKFEVTVLPDASVKLNYSVQFRNNPGAHAIDIVDLGLPHKDYDFASMRASLDGSPLSTIRRSQYVNPGVEVHLGAHAIPPEGSGTLSFQCTMPNMVYQDTTRKTHASLRITPTWFGSQYVTGNTELKIAVHLPKGVQPGEVVYQLNKPFSGKAVYQERAVVYWEFAATRFDGEHLVGLSFPKDGMTRVVTMTPWQLLAKWFAESVVQPFARHETGRLVSGILFLVLLALGWIRFAGGTGGCLLLALILGALIVMAASPAVHLLSWPVLVVAVFFSERALRRKKTSYLPPVLSVEGGGIKRGLTAPEAAVVLELPLNKVLTLVLTGLLKKGLAEQTGENPLHLQVTDRYREPKKARLNRAQQDGVVIHNYEHKFLDLITELPETPVPRIDFEAPMRELIRATARKMKGFDLDDTREYYRAVVAKAWEEADALGELPEREKKVDKHLEWLILEDDFEGRFRRWGDRGYTYHAPWSRPVIIHHHGSEHGVGPVEAPLPTAAPSAPIPSPGERTSFGDVATSFVGSAENLMGNTAVKLDPVSLGTGKPEGGVINLSGFDKVAGDFFKALSESSSGGGGGGGGCACACAGCACACACAGGGR